MAKNNLPLGMQFRTCENFGESTDSSLVLSPKFSQIQKPHRKSFDCDSQSESTTNQTKSCNSPSLQDSAQGEELWQSTKNNNSCGSIFDEKSGLCSHERGNKTDSSIDEASGKLHDFSPQDEFVKTPKFRSVIVGASGLSLGISIVVAIMLGIGAGVLMQKIFGVFWVLFLGVFWGIAAAVLNVYKVYKAELRDFEKLANDPKYKNTNR